MFPSISSVGGFESRDVDRVVPVLWEGVYGCIYVSLQMCLDIECLLLLFAAFLPWARVSCWTGSLHFQLFWPVNVFLVSVCLHAFMLVLLACATMLGFLMGSGDLNSGPHACTASAFTCWATFPASRLWGTAIQKCYGGLFSFLFLGE